MTMKPFTELFRKAHAVMIVAVAAAGCTAAGDPVPSTPTPAAAPAGATPSRFTPADVHFMTMMIGHHAQAITMSEMAPTHGANPSIRTLAARIINAQIDEIKLMQQWLQDRNQPVPDPAASGHAHHGGPGGHSHMPGMLTEAQLQELDAARGTEFDKLYLKYMIQHHQGAVNMVDDLVKSAGAAQDDKTFKIVSDMNVDQATEIRRMQLMLFDLVIGKEDQ